MQASDGEYIFEHQAAGGLSYAITYYYLLLAFLIE